MVESFESALSGMEALHRARRLARSDRGRLSPLTEISLHAANGRHLHAIAPGGSVVKNELN